MDWKGLEQHLLAKHPGEPHKTTRITHALALARDGLQHLEALGYRYYLAEGQGPVFPKWPKIMFHVDAAPNGRIVRSEYEYEELGQGWFPTQLEAQLWDGTQTQFAGRGGVPRVSVPAVGRPPSMEEIVAFQKEVEKAKDDLVRRFKAGTLNQTLPEAQDAE